MLSKLEIIEEYLFNQANNGTNIIERIKNIYSFLGINESDIILSGNEMFVFENAAIKIVSNIDKLKKKQTIEFKLESEFNGIFYPGDKVYGTVLKVQNAGIRRNEEITVILYKIAGSGKEHEIYKKITITGTKRHIIGGKTIDKKRLIVVN